MAGVSKHYALILGHYTYLDYQILGPMRNLLFDNCRTEVQQRLFNTAADNIYALPGGWRPKLQRLIAMIPKNKDRNWTIKEFLVHPGRSYLNCRFRNLAAGCRLFKGKAKKAPKPILVGANWGNGLEEVRDLDVIGLDGPPPPPPPARMFKLEFKARPNWAII